ncbi:MAG: hypothetical protein HZC22_07835 [Rhodocyclales bacterium]|nr:hypothetical protein [Rhodocyclales bacterium]
MKTSWPFSIATVAMLLLSSNAVAISCNKNAAVHQSKARDIHFKVMEVGQTPSQEDEEFVICMMDQKEDKDAFRRRVAKLRGQDKGETSRQPSRNQHFEAVRVTAPVPGFASDAEQNQPTVTIRRHQVKEIKVICQSGLAPNIPARQFTICTELGGVQ